MSNENNDNQPEQKAERDRQPTGSIDGQPVEGIDGQPIISIFDRVRDERLAAGVHLYDHFDEKQNLSYFFEHCGEVDETQTMPLHYPESY